MTNFRSEDERADLVAAAREMREAGMAMHEIARELAVPVSTLFRWAAEGGWRGKDIAAARLRAVFASSPPSLSSSLSSSPSPSSSGRAQHGPGDPGPDAEGSLNRSGMGGPVEPGHDNEGGGDGGGEGGGGEGAAAPPPMTPLEARAAGERAFKGAMALMEAGELKTAGEAMRLAERMLLAARLLAGLPLPQDDSQNYQARRAALEAKIARLLEREREEEEAAPGGGTPGGYWPPDRESRDLDAEYGFTQHGEPRGGPPASSR
ncbi:hypothetical protein E5163_02760 [Marinicauda algicola]|uniref:Uncharacterized protein n=1 Tax=Marinicauda algicola TaxID=2029849 RepID=A0A4S2H3C4_9PROT|nr:hypothetical protein [Marinicauda algicola]TGY90066.1 hypothetical protein E5163_02760 [Marinicauda algicola]